MLYLNLRRCAFQSENSKFMKVPMSEANACRSIWFRSTSADLLTKSPRLSRPAATGEQSKTKLSCPSRRPSTSSAEDSLAIAVVLVESASCLPFLSSWIQKEDQRSSRHLLFLRLKKSEVRPKATKQHQIQIDKYTK